ncbi:MAG: hypothetical protein ACLFR7_10290 [Opitutales bacterium]
MTPLHRLGPGLATLEYPLRMLGLTLGRRVTVLEGAPGRWVVHSTAPFTTEDVTAIRELGEPVALADCTVLHDTYAKEGRTAFAGIPYFAPGPLPRRKWGADARPLSALAEQTAPHLQWIRLEGLRSSLLEEWAVFQPASRTLVVCDLLLNLKHAQGWTRWSLRHLAGVREWPAIDRPFRLAVRDRAAFHASLRRLGELPFERLIPAHGDIIEKDAPMHFREACARAGYPLL